MSINGSNTDTHTKEESDRERQHDCYGMKNLIDMQKERQNSPITTIVNMESDMKKRRKREIIICKLTPRQ
jgi:hypothetical protein